jgi:hypothetical protein
MDKKPAEEKVKDLSASIDGFEPSVLPIDGGGGIATGAFPPDLAPLLDFEKDSVCTIGPCRHYWRLVVPVDVAEPGSYGELGHQVPRRTIRSCLAHPGTESSLSGDAPVYECNRWDPFSGEEAASKTRLLDSMKIRQRQKREEEK